MDIEDITLALILFIMALFIGYYISDYLRIKSLKGKLNLTSYLGKLKDRLLIDVMDDKNKLIFYAIMLSVIYFVLLLIQSPVHQIMYGNMHSKIIAMNNTALNKTVEELSNIAKDQATRYADQFAWAMGIYMGAITLFVIALFGYYIYYKLNIHFRIEEGIKENSLRGLLERINVRTEYIPFYLTLEEKHGRARKKETAAQLASFIYATSPLIKSRK